MNSMLELRTGRQVARRFNIERRTNRLHIENLEVDTILGPHEEYDQTR
jgi:hypothetical protein